VDAPGYPEDDVGTATASDGTSIYYETWGRGEPLLLVAGLTADLRIWACQRMVFGRHRRCIALDNRGAGRSAKPSGPYSLEQMAADAAAGLDAEGVDRVDVVAYSMGSYAAQILAMQQPERISSLVLAGTAARHHPWRRELLAGWSELAATRGMHVAVRHAFPYLMGPRTARRFGLWINALWPLLVSQPAHAFCAQVDAILAADDSDAAARLGAIAAPTLVVAGSEDQLTPSDDGAEVASLIPGAGFEEIPGAGHGLMQEAAPAFNSADLSFLQAGGNRSKTTERALVQPVG
jgi:pimeloyl-ACP methyl ester carboxylesterase